MYARWVVESRTRLTVDERRTQLLELGLGLFGERSYDDVSIDDIAHAAGVSKGLLYHYFGGKRAFYIACVEHAAAGLLAHLDRVRAGQPADADGARAGLGAYLDYVDARASSYVALMRSGIGTDPEILSTLEKARAVIVARMVEGLGLEVPRPIFRLAARSWIGQVEAACLDWLEHRDVPREALVQLLLAALWTAIFTATTLDPEAGVKLGPPPG